MPRRRTALLAATVLAGGIPVAATALAAAPACGSELAPPKLAFGKQVIIDKVRPGGEPVSIVAQDGSISVSAHGGTTHLYKDPGSVPSSGPGLVSTYANQTLNWRSTDNGKSWKYVGLGDTGQGPHTATSTGFSDPDFAMDAGGRIYNTEIDLVNVAVFSSGDDGQTYSRGVAEVTSGDRPWLTAGRKNEVYLYVNLPQQILRSADGGLTWSLQSRGDQAGPNAKMYIDPKNPNGLIGPHKDQGVSISADQGKTWKAYDGAALDKTEEFFGAVAVDKAGDVYRAAAGGYSGEADKKAREGVVSFNAFDRKTMRWGATVRIPAPEGDMLWPWAVAGDEGRVAVAWYQRRPAHPDRFEMFVAATTNAKGTKVRCRNGTTRFVPSQWTVASAGVIHTGVICLSGTGCNAATSADRCDRRLGDFFTVNYDKDGRIFVVSASTVAGREGESLTSSPVFVAATSGPKMTAKPMKTRKTRPSCGLNPLC